MMQTLHLQPSKIVTYQTTQHLMGAQPRGDQSSRFPGISNFENQIHGSQNNQKWEISHFLTVKSSFCVRMQTLQIAANLSKKGFE